MFEYIKLAFAVRKELDEFNEANNALKNKIAAFNKRLDETESLMAAAKKGA